jgi:hypothetical protein
VGSSMRAAAARLLGEETPGHSTAAGRRRSGKRLAAPLAVGVLATTLGAFLAFAPVTLARRSRHKPPTYEVHFYLKGKFFSNIQGKGYSTNETDTFSVLTLYDGFTAQAGAQTIKSQLDDSGGSDWQGFGHFGVGSYNCHGDLHAEGNAVLHATVHKGVMHLEVEAVPKDFQVSSAKGTDTGTGHVTCGSTFDGTYAFYPDGLRYMPKAMTVKAQVPLKKLRNLKSGALGREDLTDANAEEQFPNDCSGDGSTLCTQHLHWHGDVRIVRAN